MRFTTKSEYQKNRERNEWRRHFAWFPTKIIDDKGGPDVWVWLEFIERATVYNGADRYYYRTIDK